VTSPGPERTLPALRVADLDVTYRNGHQALAGISLEVHQGERVGIVGSSGCGKSTLMKAILGVLPRRTTVGGSIRILERELTGLPERQLRALRGVELGYVAQDPFVACDPLHRVEHHVAEAWTAHRRTPPPGAVVDALAHIGIPDAADRSRQYPHQWSGGMLQRATTMAAVAHRPVVTLADEPTSALDAEFADDALQVLTRNCSALVVVSHDLALIARHTDRIVVLEQGRIVEEGPSAAVLGAPAHTATRRLREASELRPRQPVPPVEAAPRTDAVVTLTAVTRRYRVAGRDVDAVRDATLTVHPGEVVGIVGRSGSGKSTLLRLAAGIEQPDTGTVLLGTRTLWRTACSVEHVPPGFVMPIFQDPVASLDRRWPLWRTLTEPLVLQGQRMSRQRRRDRAAAELASVGLESVSPNRLPDSLSVGQCQRVAVLRALIARPALLVADEPTASLDVEAAAAVTALLRAAADDGSAVLVVSHDHARIRSFADRTLTMTDGRPTRELPASAVEASP
jgi:peptide/nickel transport system ATP-binding protein